MTKNLIINQFNLISMFDFSSNFVSTLTVRIPHCYVTLLLSKFLGGSCQEYTEAWWKIYILIVVLRSSSPPHGGGCFHHGKKEVGGCLLCEKLTMHSGLKMQKNVIINEYTGDCTITSKPKINVFWKFFFTLQTPSSSCFVQKIFSKKR